MTTTRLDRWIFETFPATTRGLALYRIAFAAFVLLAATPGHSAYSYFNFRLLGTLPDAFFLPPPGPMMLFGGFPAPLLWELFHAALTLALVALLLGIRTRWASLATGGLFLLGCGFSYSLGKVNHTMLFGVVPLVMAFSGWGRAWSFDARSRTRRGAPEREAVPWTLTLLALLIGFGWFTAGFSKLIGGWLNPATQATYGHLAKQVLLRDRTDLLATAALDLRLPLLWELLDWATLVLELGFLPAVLSRRVFRGFLVAAVVFHFGTMLTMNIAFSFNLIAYAAFVDWTRLARSRPVQRAAVLLSGVRASWSAALILLGGALLLHAFGSPLFLLDAVVEFDSDLTGHEVALNTVALLIGLGLSVAALQRRSLRVT